MNQSVLVSLGNGSLQLFCQQRHYLVQITNDTIVGDIEDRCILILVDGNDDIGLFHAGNMLDRTGNTDCEVNMRTDSLTSLANLQFLRLPACINNCSGAGYCSTQNSSQIIQKLEVFSRTNTTAAGNKDLGSRDIRNLGDFLDNLFDCDIAVVLFQRLQPWHPCEAQSSA